MKYNTLFYKSNWQKSICKSYIKNKFKNKIFYYQNSNEKDLHTITKISEESFSKWNNYNLKERKKVIKLITSVLIKNKKKLAKYLSLDTGKEVNECQKEIVYCHSLWAEALKVKNKFFINRKKISKNTKITEIKDGIGVVGLFIPFNNYLIVLSERLPYLLLSGSVSIIKPNELGIQALLKFLDLLRSKLVKYPSIINMIVGDIKISKKIVLNKKIQMIDFTGSKEVGKKIALAGAKNFKRISLELGGKNPSIICKDASLNKASSVIANDFTGNSGQNCVAISRVYIDKLIYDDFKKRLIDQLNKYNFNQPLRDIKKQNFLKDYFRKNKLILKNNLVYGQLVNNSNILKPLVFENIKENHYLLKNELFAPVLIMNKFNDLNELIETINQSEYGLSGSLWTQNVKYGEQMLSKVESGRLWLNGSIFQNYPFLRVGGMKSSGNGRVAGKESIENYSKHRTIIINKQI